MNLRACACEAINVTEILFLRYPNIPEVGVVQGRIKGGGQRWQLPRALRSKGASRDDIYLF